MTAADKRERVAKSELIEKVNQYFGDLGLDETYAVSAIETLTAELLDDDDLERQANSNIKVDFGNSPGRRLQSFLPQQNSGNSSVNGPDSLPRPSFVVSGAPFLSLDASGPAATVTRTMVTAGTAVARSQCPDKWVVVSSRR